MKEQIVEVKIALETVNSVFVDNFEAEVSRILASVAAKVYTGEKNQDILDINGNKVGYAIFVSRMVEDTVDEA